MDTGIPVQYVRTETGRREKEREDKGEEGKDRMA